MSLYQFAAVIDGVNEMNAGDDVQAPTAEEFETAVRTHEAVSGQSFG